MAETSGIIRLEDLVNGYLWQSGMSREEYRRLFDMAVDGVRELNILHTKEGRTTTKLTMDANLVVQFPDDMIGFVSVGVPYKGRYWSYSRDDTILDVADRDATGPDVENPRRGYLWTYGAKGAVNTKGYYRVNYNRREILFDHVNRDDIILVYTSSGVNTDADTYIPVMYKSAIYAYLAYESNVYRLGVPEVKLERYKRKYETEIDKLNTLQASTLDEWQDVLYGLMTPGVIR